MRETAQPLVYAVEGSPDEKLSKEAGALNISLEALAAPAGYSYTLRWAAMPSSFCLTSFYFPVFLEARREIQTDGHRSRS